MKTKGAIYYNTNEFEKAQNYLDKLLNKLNEIEQTNIIKVIKNKFTYICYLSNGDQWECIPCYENQRGKRHTISFYSDTIDFDIIKVLIIPSTTWGIGITKKINLNDN